VPELAREVGVGLDGGAPDVVGESAEAAEFLAAAGAAGAAVEQLGHGDAMTDRRPEARVTEPAAAGSSGVSGKVRTSLGGRGRPWGHTVWPTVLR
jgi:hypothetical protein